MQKSTLLKFKWYSPLQKLKNTIALHFKEGTLFIEIIYLEIICLQTEPLKIYITKKTEVGKLEYNQIIQETKNNPGHILAYTDSSKINKEVGASVCIPELKTKAVNYIEMNQVSIVYTGELKGL